jgi:hypothetical protein
MTTRPRSVACAALVAIAVAACGPVRDASPPESPPPPGPPPPLAAGAASEAPREGAASMEPHIRDALAELERAERTLDGLVAPQPERAGDSRPTTPPRAGAKKDTPQAPAPPSKSAPASGPCGTACDALASMRRSATYLCRLTGDGDPRCAQALERVRVASERVRATCGSCEPGGDLRGRLERSRGCRAS